MSLIGFSLGGAGGVAAASEMGDPSVEEIIADVTGGTVQSAGASVELGGGVAVEPLSNGESFVSHHEGGTSIVTEITEGAGVESVRFDMALDDGLDVILLPDGDGAVVDLDAIDALVGESGAAAGAVDISSAIVATIAEPWAVDASGKSLDTHYGIDGTALVQYVDTDGADFPIAADPTVSLGWKWTFPVYYVKYSKGETMDISTYVPSRLTALNRFACGIIPYAGDICKALVTNRAEAFVNTAKRGVKSGQCLTIWAQVTMPNTIPIHSFYTRKC